MAVSTLSAEEIIYYQTAANEKAESVYGAALVHCLTSQTMLNEKVESGIYKFDFSKELNSDMSLLELSVCNRMHSEDVNVTSGYAVVEIRNGFAEVAYFCEEDCFGDDYESFDPSLVNCQNYIVGVYFGDDE